MYDCEFGRALAEAMAGRLERGVQKIVPYEPPHHTGAVHAMVWDDSRMPPVLICALPKYEDGIIVPECLVAGRAKWNGSSARAAVSVIVPERIKSMKKDRIVSELKAGCAIEYAAYQTVGQDGLRRFPHSSKSFLPGDMHDVADIIPLIATPREDTDSMADRVACAVGEASSLLQAESGKYAGKAAGTGLNSPRIAALVWLYAMLAHRRLASCRSDIRPVSHVTGAAALADDWSRIGQWSGIFGPAAKTLKEFAARSPAPASKALQILSDTLDKAGPTWLGPISDIGAELFPKISPDRTAAAEYYTRIPVAQMLAALTIKGTALPIGADYFKDHRMADLACGTGTLLRAGYSRILSLHQRGGPPILPARLHQDAVNGGIVGVDVSPAAAYLAAAALLSMRDTPSSRRISIGPAEVGGPLGLTGSIEYIRDAGCDRTLDDFGGAADAPARVPVRDGSVDHILMNPPYSRSRFGNASFDIAGLTDAERRACQIRWQRLIAGHPAKKVAGMAPTFVVIAARKLRAHGRMGFVLPITAAFAEAWADTRLFIRQNFTDIMAVTANAGDSLSHDTALSEMLLIATKLPAPRQELSDVYCATLSQAASEPGEALEIARAIQRCHDAVSGWSAPILAGDEVGRMYKYSPRGGQPWSPLGAAHPDAALAAERLSCGQFPRADGATVRFGVRMAPMQDVFDIGPTHHLIGHTAGRSPMGAFEMHRVDQGDTDEAAGHPPGDKAGSSHYSLWGVRSYQKTILARPTHRAVAKNGGAAAAILQRNTTLFYNRRLVWESNALLGAATDRKIMGGNGWLGLGHSDSRVLKAAALWFNSAPGLMVHWTQASRSEPGRATAQLRAIRNIPCPRLDALNSKALDEAARIFEEVKSLILQPACRLDADAVRHRIDAAVLRMLGLPPDALHDMDRLRRLFCEEPTVNRPRRPSRALRAQHGSARPAPPAR